MMQLAQDPEAAARRRMIEALEELHAAAKALGLDPDRIGEIHAPLQLRADAWCWRVERDAAAWQRLVRSGYSGLARPPLRVMA